MLKAERAELCLNERGRKVMDRRAALSPAERTRRWRARDKVGRKVYEVELVDASAEAVVASCGHDVSDMRAGMTAIFQRLIDLEPLVTRHGETLEKVFLSLFGKYRIDDGELKK
jgi:hypothetical protein